MDWVWPGHLTDLFIQILPVVVPADYFAVALGGSIAAMLVWLGIRAFCDKVLKIWRPQPVVRSTCSNSRYHPTPPPPLKLHGCSRCPVDFHPHLALMSRAVC